VSGFDGTASFETPPLAAPQDETSPMVRRPKATASFETPPLAAPLDKAYLLVRRPKAVSNHGSGVSI
jgi:hypothetical protein